MTVGITNQKSPAESQNGVGQLHRPPGYETKRAATDCSHRRCSVGDQHGGLPVDQIVGAGVAWKWAAVLRGKVLQKLDPRPGRGTESRDMEPSALDVVQVLLLGAEVHALTGDPKAEQVTIKRKTGAGAADHYGGVIDAK